MGCMNAIFGIILPRFALLVGWYNDPTYWNALFGSQLWLGLGFLFLPWTTLAYTWCYAYSPGLGGLNGGVTGIGWFIVILAFLVDLGSYGSSDRYRRSRSAY
jgi:hypothetical protein